MPEKFENAVPTNLSTNLSRKRSFKKTLLKPEEFETAEFRFLVDGEHFENRAFDNHGVRIII